jgi:large subunit ribosomal protein L15
VNNAAIKATVINVSQLEAAFEAGADVNPKILVAQGLVAPRSGKAPAVKILGTGELTKKLSVSNCVVSASAKTKIEKAGGVILA